MARSLSARAGNPPGHDPPLEDHGSLRRPNPLHHQERHRPDASRRHRDGARSRVPGVRHTARADRQGAGHRRPAGRHLLLLRRHVAGPRHRSRPLPGEGRGGDVRVVYSPLDAVELAVKNPDRQVVFFGVGFETTGAGQRHELFTWPSAAASRTFRCWCRMCSCPPAIEAI